MIVENSILLTNLNPKQKEEVFNYFGFKNCEYGVKDGDIIVHVFCNTSDKFILEKYQIYYLFRRGIIILEKDLINRKFKNK
jgi:hypothetical protein